MAAHVPSALRCIGMGWFCQEVKSPANRTTLALGAVKRKVCVPQTAAAAGVAFAVAFVVLAALVVFVGFVAMELFGLEVWPRVVSKLPLTNPYSRAFCSR